MTVLFQWIMSQLLRGYWEKLDIKHSMVMCNGFKTEYTSSEPLKTLVILCVVSPSASEERVDTRPAT